jgi:hypothetical protein
MFLVFERDQKYQKPIADMISPTLPCRSIGCHRMVTRSQTQLRREAMQLAMSIEPAGHEGHEDHEDKVEDHEDKVEDHEDEVEDKVDKPSCVLL